jgi:hypothetical protein
MTKADRVLSTPPTNSSAILAGTLSAGAETAEPTTERAGSPTLSRRNLLLTGAGAAAAVVLPSASLTALAASSDAVEFAAYASEPEGPVPSLAEWHRGPLAGPFPEYPPEIFGKVPEGFVLEEQQIEMLCFWHRKAIEVLDRPIEDDEELTAFCEIKNRILGAILSVRPATAGRVAAQLRAVVAEIDCLETGGTVPVSVEEVLDVHDIVKMANDLTTATAPIAPKKDTGAFYRDGKLTREGLLARYQSFLFQELETVSWNLYGERDYAKHFVFYDRAVQERCQPADHGGPFFDENSLPDRARAVLQTLNIDAETAHA